jgi:hypothetical protein
MDNQTDAVAAPKFPALGDFVAGFVSPLYARRVTDTTDVQWCPKWWRHREAVERLHVMWQCFEAARRSGHPMAASDWWIQVADPHMRILLSPRGPFAHCSAAFGHHDYLRPLPIDGDCPIEFFLPATAPQTERTTTA